MTNRLFVYNDAIGFYLGYVKKTEFNKFLEMTQLKFVSADDSEICIITDPMDKLLANELYQRVVNAICDQTLMNRNVFDIDFEIKEVLNDFKNNKETKSE